MLYTADSWFFLLEGIVKQVCMTLNMCELVSVSCFFLRDKDYKQLFILK